MTSCDSNLQLLFNSYEPVTPLLHFGDLILSSPPQQLPRIGYITATLKTLELSYTSFTLLGIYFHET
jgi:hypothetical protein